MILVVVISALVRLTRFGGSKIVYFANEPQPLVLSFDELGLNARIRNPCKQFSFVSLTNMLYSLNTRVYTDTWFIM